MPGQSSCHQSCSKKYTKHKRTVYSMTFIKSPESPITPLQPEMVFLSTVSYLTDFNRTYSANWWLKFSGHIEIIFTLTCLLLQAWQNPHFFSGHLSNGISHSGKTVSIKIVSADIIFNYIIHTTDRVYGLPQTTSLQGGMIMSEIPLLNHLACTKNLCK